MVETMAVAGRAVVGTAAALSIVGLRYVIMLWVDKIDVNSFQGETPVSLAEFTLATSSGQTFYDISLVDGYNLPIAIVSLYPESGNASLTEIPPNLTNPICIGTASLLAAEGSTSDASGTIVGTNSSFPIPLEQDQSQSDVQSWCPWDLQLNTPSKPGDGVYPYPDDKIQRPVFNPCYSACAKYNHPSDCCTGSYDSPDRCKPSLYSKEAKKVCPDAYSFGWSYFPISIFVEAESTLAFDDQTSTFIIPSGGGFEVSFCPTGRSSNILKVYSKQLFQLAATGHVSPEMLADTQNVTLQKMTNGGSEQWTPIVLLLVLAVGSTAFLWA